MRRRIDDETPIFPIKQQAWIVDGPIQPQKVTGARRVPLRNKAGANNVVEDLINKIVIVPVSRTTDWCSPAFCVPKAEMI